MVKQVLSWQRIRSLKGRKQKRRRVLGSYANHEKYSYRKSSTQLLVYRRCKLLCLGELRTLFVRCHTAHTRSLLTWTVCSPPSFYTFTLTVDRHHSLSPRARCRAHRKPPSYLYLIRHLAPARNASNQRPFSIFPSARSSSQVARYTYDSLSRAVGATSALMACVTTSCLSSSQAARAEPSRISHTRRQTAPSLRGMMVWDP